MGMSPKDFEDYGSKLLFERMKSDLPSNTSFKQNVKIKGRSGTSHQIDLAITYEIDHTKHLMLVEFKSHSRRVGKNVVTNLIAILEDINAQKGFIISSNGFQSGAKELAKSKGVALAMICDFVYTPLQGDLDYYSKYIGDIKKYLSVSSGKKQPRLELNYGNAYRAEKILPISVANDEYSNGRIKENGFLMISSDNEALVDIKDIHFVLMESIRLTNYSE